MTHSIAHFSINADDVDRARRFYEGVFGWRFEAFGPPEFFRIHTADDPGAIGGALQRRREIVPGKAMFGFECTIAVADVDATARSVVNAGGRIVMDRSTIAGVGHLVFFEDPEGNIVGAMQYDPAAE